MTQPLFEYLRGDWLLFRTITDRRADQNGSFEGRAVFAGDGARLDYSETGTLRLGEAEIVATRTYIWSFADQRAAVAFADGSPFHRFSRDHPRAEHLCGEDWYFGEYDFGDHEWSVTWRVEGPRKDYTSLTRYTRP